MNTSSISCGISPASSAAVSDASATNTSATAAHSAFPNAATPTRTPYGRGLLPCTLATAPPVSTSSAMIWPCRA